MSDADMMAHPFYVGRDVAIIGRDGWLKRSITKGTVAKSYKTGHVTVGDSPQRYRTFRSGDGFGATATGDSWHRNSLELWTPKHDGELAAQTRREVFSRMADRLGRAIRFVPTIAQVEAITALVASIEESK